MLNLSNAVLDLEIDRWRLEASREMAKDLLARQPERLAGWTEDELTAFVFHKTRDAEAFGLRSKADASAFVETLLLIAPSLDLTREFREAVASAPDSKQRMVHAISMLPPGFFAQLAVSDAPARWLDRMRQP